RRGRAPPHIWPFRSRSCVESFPASRSARSEPCRHGRENARIATIALRKLRIARLCDLDRSGDAARQLQPRAAAPGPGFARALLAGLQVAFLPNQACVGEAVKLQPQAVVHASCPAQLGARHQAVVAADRAVVVAPPYPAAPLAAFRCAQGRLAERVLERETLV